MFNKIHHLVYGRLVFKSYGFVEGSHSYRFEIYGNLGDFYKVEGITKLGYVDFPIAYGKLDRDKANIQCEKYWLINTCGKDLIGGLDLIDKGWT